MRLYISAFALLVTLATLFMPAANSAVTDSVSEAGEELRILQHVENTVDGVKEALLNEDLAKARELYERAIESDSTYAPARYALAKQLLYEKPDSAVLHARKAYEADTTNHWYLGIYAQGLVGVERYDEAMEIYKRLIKLQPRDLNAYRILAILYNRNKQHEEAIATLDSAELKAGRHSYLTSLKRQILISTNQVGRAVAETQAEVNENPYSAESRVALAELYASISIDSLAQREYGAAMKIDSSRLETLLSYGNYLEQRGQESEYLAILRLVMSSNDVDLNHKISLVNEIIGNSKLYRREYLKVGDLIRVLLLQNPKNPQLIDMQTRHLISLGMIDEALKYMKSHLDDEPANLEHYRTVVGIERHLQRPDSVEHYLLLASERFPDESSLRFERAYTLTTQQRYDEAIECYKAEMKGATDSLKSSVMGTIGDLYYQMSIESRVQGDEKSANKQIKSSYKYYDKALRLDRDNSMVMNNYAYFLSENGGDLNRAHDMSKRSTEIEVSNPTYLDTYAWILYRMGEFKEAKVVMRQAISFDTSQNGEIALHYGEILSVLGEDTMANFYWDKAIEWGMSKEQVVESRKRAVKMKELYASDNNNKKKR